MIDWRPPRVTDGHADVPAAASAPIAHQETTYGVLTVHAGCPGAFDAEECSIMGYLGSHLGHAIVALRRKRVLNSEAAIELEIRAPDVLTEQGVADPPARTIQIDELVEVEAGTVLAYGTTSADGRDGLETVAAESARWDAVTESWKRDGQLSFEARLSNPPFLSTLASMECRVKRAVIDGADLHATVLLAPDVDVRRVVDRLQDRCPKADVVSKRRTIRPDDHASRIALALTNDLTDRQEQALRTAYVAGYFERPRDTTAAEMADRLDISNATFSQHLRTAQNKLFEALFEE